MDLKPQYRKSLAHCVQFLQAELEPTRGIVDSLQQSGVLSDDDVRLIENESSQAEKVFTLVHCLRQKETPQIIRFLKVLDSKGSNNIASVLRNQQQASDAQEINEQTDRFLRQCLGKKPLPPAIVRRLSCNLITKDQVIDQIEGYREKVKQLEKQVEKLQSGRSHDVGIGNTHYSPGTRDDDITEPKTLYREGDSEGVDQGQTIVRDLQQLRKENSELKRKLHRKEENGAKILKDFENLREMLKQAQDDADHWHDKCKNRAHIISLLSHDLEVSEEEHSSEREHNLLEKTQGNLELQQKLKASELRVKQTKDNLKETSRRLEQTETELEHSRQKEYRLKEKIGLPHVASEKEVEEKIAQLITDDADKTEKLNELSKELIQVTKRNDRLKDTVDNLRREKTCLEFELRQKGCAYRRVVSQIHPALESRSPRRAEPGATVDKAPTAQKPAYLTLSLPPFEDSYSRPSVSTQPPSVSLHTLPDPLFCVVCRQEFDINEDHICRNHFRPLRKGRWTCCKNESSSEGCLVTRHMYVQKSGDAVYFSTLPDETHTLRMA